MKYRGIFKRAAALTMAGALACSTALCTAADGNQAADKSETVYVTMNSDGSVASETDSVWLHADSGLSGYSDETSLSDITMLKGTEEPEQSSGRLVFSTGDTDAWYQGTADQDLPVTTTLTWTLDGQEMKAEDMTGKSGHLVLHVSFANNTLQTETIDGTARSICTPFVTVVAATLDADVFSNVTSDNATIQSDSSRDLVGAVCLPGLADSYDGLLTGSFSTLSDYLHDDVTIEADVTNFSMPMMYIAAATSAKELDQAEELQDYDDVFTDLDKLDDAMQELIDGGKALLDGTSKVNDGTGTLLSGITALDNGAASLQNGANQVQSGAHQVSDGAAAAASGAGQLQSGLNTLSGQSQTLRDGAASAAAGILTTVQGQLVAAGYAQADVAKITLDDTSVLEGWMSAVPAEQAANIRAQLIQGVKAAAAQQGQTLDDASAQKIVNIASYLLNTGTETDTNTALSDAAGIAGKASAYKTGYARAVGELTGSAAATYAISSVSEICLAQALPAATAAVQAQVQAQATAAVLASAGLTQAQYDALPEGDTNRAAIDASIAQAVSSTMALQTTQDQIKAAATSGIPTAYAQIRAALVGKGVPDSSADLAIVYASDLLVDDMTSATAPNAVYAGSFDTAAADALARLAALSTADAGAQSSDDYIIGKVYHDNADASLQAALTAIKGAKGLRDGVNQYTAGVDTAASKSGELVSGLNTLASGASSLASGTDSLKNGTDQLKTGADQLKTGAETLYGGTETLQSGAQELYDGLVRFNTEGISKLTSSEDLANLQSVLDVTDAVKAAREDYTSFAGIGDNTTSTVKFVMKVSEDKDAADAAQAASAQTSGDTTQESGGNWFADLWKRIVALFNT